MDSELNKLTMYYKVLTILSLNFWPRMNTDFTRIFKKKRSTDTKVQRKIISEYLHEFMVKETIANDREKIIRKYNPCFFRVNQWL